MDLKLGIGLCLLVQILGLDNVQHFIATLVWIVFLAAVPFGGVCVILVHHSIS